MAWQAPFDMSGLSCGAAVGIGWTAADTCNHCICHSHQTTNIQKRIMLAQKQTSWRMYLSNVCRNNTRTSLLHSSQLHSKPYSRPVDENGRHLYTHTHVYFTPRRCPKCFTKPHIHILSHTHIQYARMHQWEAAAMQSVWGRASCPMTLGHVSGRSQPPTLGSLEEPHRQLGCSAGA